MQRLYRNANHRVVLFRLCVSFGMLAVVAAIGFAIMRPSNADLDAEKRLIGKWEVWYVNYDPTVPPDRIIEWKPNGGTAHFSPELESWGDTDENEQLSSTWRIRQGKLITETRNPPVFRGTMRDSVDLFWESDDAVVFTATGVNGQKVQLHYHRLLGTPTALREAAEPSVERKSPSSTKLLVDQIRRLR